MRTLILTLDEQVVGEVTEAGDVRTEDERVRAAAEEPGTIGPFVADGERRGTQFTPVAIGAPGYLEAIADTLVRGGYGVRVEDR